MKNKGYRNIFALLLILFIPVIITGCSQFDTLKSTGSTTKYALTMNEIEYNFPDHDEYNNLPGINPEPADHFYEKDSTAYLEVYPTEEVLFYEWSGEDGRSVEYNNGQYIIYMNSSKSITPVFGLAPEDNKILIQGNVEINHNYPFSVLEDEDFYEIPTFSSTTASTDYFSSQSFNRSERKVEEVTELIISFEDFIGIEKINQILSELNFEKIGQIPELNSLIVKVPEMALEEAIEMAEEIQGIKYAEPNRKVQVLNDYNYNGFENHLSIPDDTQYKEQWHYPLIRLPQAWELIKNSSPEPVRIAVLDTGIDDKHEDLENHINEADGINVINHEDNDNVNDFYDDNGHGTHVAGTIGAINNNGTGVSGILQNIEIIPIKALDSSGQGSISDIVKGISYAAGLADSSISEKVDIINMSFGINSSSSSLEDVIKKAHENNVILVSASGNNPQFDEEKLVYPAAYQEVISVGSVSLNSNYTPERSDFSNYSNESSPKLDFVAPGNSLLSTSPGDRYETRIGTSMAAPHVAGLIGLMLSQEAVLSEQEIRERLARTSMKINDDSSYHDEETGYGLINAYWALNDVQEIKIILSEEGILENDDNSIKIRNDKIVEQKTIPLEDFYDTENYKFDFVFNGIEPGNYRLIGLIDVNNNSSDDDYIVIKPGDYFFSKIFNDIDLQPDEHYEFEVNLQEYNGNL